MKDVLASDQIDRVEDAGVLRRQDLPDAQAVPLDDRLQGFDRHRREIR